MPSLSNAQQTRGRPDEPPMGRQDYAERIAVELKLASDANEAKTLVLDGPRGSGKSCLIDWVAGVAEQYGLAVVRGLPSFKAEIDGPAVRSPDSALASAATQRSRPRPSSVGRASVPVMVLVDDAQWLTPDMVQEFRKSMAKWRKHPVLWLLAFRPEDRGPAGTLLTENITKVGYLPELAPLSAAAIRSIATETFGASPTVELVALLESVEMPGPLHELMHGLLDDGAVAVIEGSAKLVDQSASRSDDWGAIESAGAFDDATSLPARFLDMVKSRLDALPGMVRQFLQVAAVLGQDFAPADVAEMLKKSPAELLPVIQHGLTAGFMVVDVDSFRFATAPLRLATLKTVPLPARTMLHRQAAEVMLAHSYDRFAAANHLARGARPGDSGAVRMLTEVSTDLIGCDPAKSAELAVQGLRLSAPGSGEYQGLAVIACEALTRCGSPRRAALLCQTLIDNGVGDSVTLQVLRQWACTASFLRGAAIDAASMATSLLAADARLVEVEVVRLAAESLCDAQAAASRAEQLLEANSLPRSALQGAARTVLALARWRDGQVIEALELARGGGDEPWFYRPSWLCTTLLVRARRMHEVDQVIRSIPDDVERNPCATSAVPPVLAAHAHLARGELTAAATRAEQGLAAAAEFDMPLYVPQATAILAMVALHRGDLCSARRHASQFDARWLQQRFRPWWATGFLAGGFVANAIGDRQKLDEMWMVVHNDADARRELLLEDPSVAAWLVRAAMTEGSMSLATTIVSAAETLGAENAGLNGLLHSALHARALLDRDADLLVHVVDHHDDCLSRAFAMEDLGVMLSEQDRDTAVEWLHQAATAHLGFDAAWHAARISRRLRALGVRRRTWKHAKRPLTGWDSLTETEKKVALLVSKGLTNRQAASHLFVSPHTVGFHLRQIFSKLGIGSRIELVQMYA